MLESVLDLLPIGVVVHDIDGHVLFRNGAAREVETAFVFARALREPGVACVALHEGDQLCAIRTSDVVIVFIARPHEPPSLDVAGALYGLTPTEQRIAALLSNGNSGPEVARTLRSSLHTIHSHLKSIFAKTFTSSQNELIALMRSGLALFGSPTVKGCANNSRRLHSAARVQ